MRNLSALAVAAAVVICWIGASYAVHEIGSPVPYAPQAGFSIGIGYGNYTSQWELDGGEDDGDELPGDVKQNYIYGQGSYGFMPGWEGYVRAGVSDAVLEHALGPEDGADEVVDFEGDYKFYFGVGLRGVIYDTETFQVGPFFQYNKYSDYDDELDASFMTNPITVPVGFTDGYDMNIGLGANYPVGPAGMLYGGAFAYWAKASGSFELPAPYGVMSQDFQEKNNVGGFLGLRLPLGSGLNLNFEGVYKSDLTASISINKAFGMMK